MDEEKSSTVRELTSPPYSTTTRVPCTLAIQMPMSINMDPFSLFRFLPPLLRKK